MFGKSIKLFVAIAVAASMAFAAAGHAAAGTFITDTLGGSGKAHVRLGHSYNPNAYVYGGASAQLSKAIQSRGFGPLA